MKDKKYSIIENLQYCIKATIDNYPRLIVLCILVIVLNALLPVVTTFLPKVVIDELTNGKTIRHLMISTGAFTGVIALGTGLQKFLGRLIYWHKYKMNTYFLKIVTHKSLTTDYCNQEDEHFRNLQSEGFVSCSGNFSYYAQIYDATVKFFSNLIGFITFLGLLIGLNPILIVFLVITTIISFILNKQIIKWEEENNEQKIRYEQKMQYITRMAGDIKAAKDIRVYHMADWLNQVYQKNINGLNKWYKRYASKLFKVSTSDSVFSLLRESITYSYLLYLVLNENMSVADFVLYFNVVTGFTVLLNSILGQVNTMNRLNMSINRFRAFVEYPESYCNHSDVDIKNPTIPHTIELRDVSYRYNNETENILNDINLVINPESHLAVVGLNGAGKTTLVKLICGLVDPTEGRVLYDGVDIKKYNRKEVYKLFGAVFQQFSILPVTISEIVAEDTIDQVDYDRLNTSLEQAGLMDKVNSLREGVNTKYDKTMWDDGIDLSGGEKQKLLLARALYKNSPIVILDEPTAALDPIAERNMYEIYNEVMRDKTTLFISHRLASTRFCDRIILLENGKIIEEGNHDELLNKHGRYYDLFETQAKYYREEKKYENDNKTTV
ncbi:ABC transporter ATP-binding protein [Shuttleworthella satelles]|uniref:ABC transporter, ATP-binding protein n=1 Tax=Shuttleworthella satelles DSM 14600 TaxID=626523 RepID=C4G9P5_9FIRM|nr:ABC transporter ATP-binding protein [Shuttleworthia satelles]EEP29342.1 ABC transporter, ATP-binding protein [Shuttleworthia satelles DSM 14600]